MVVPITRGNVRVSVHHETGCFLGGALMRATVYYRPRELEQRQIAATPSSSRDRRPPDFATPI